MNSKKWARFLGVVSGGPPIPEVQLQFPMDYLARFPALGGLLGPGEVGSCYTSARIDPPVGGFADGDKLLQLPTQYSKQVVTAVEVPDLARCFSPGVYRFSGMLAPPQLAGIGYLLRCANATPEAGWAIMGSDYPTIGAFGQAAGQPVFFQCDAYFSGRWWAWVEAYGAHADANVGWVSIQIQCVCLMDDGPSAR